MLISNKMVTKAIIKNLSVYVVEEWQNMNQRALNNMIPKRMKNQARGGINRYSKS